jgi:F-type H+-transporting ATPase subunit delta
MSLAPGAARRYAKAIFDLANESNSLDETTSEFKSIGDTVHGSPELSALLADPSIPEASRKAVMTEVLSRMGVSTLVRNAVFLITDHNRARLLPEIATKLTQLADERAGKLRADVTSAAPLTEAQYARLSGALEKITGRKISLARHVDATLIGGVVTRIGDTVYDGSVRSRLVELRQSLLPS